MSYQYKNQQSNLQSNKFKVVIKQLPEVSYAINSISLPSIDVEPIVQNFRGVDTNFIGSKIDYGLLQISFFIDSEMINYFSILNWLRKSIPVVKNEEYETFLTENNLYSDISLIIYSPMNTYEKTINYIRCFPISLSSPQFDTHSLDTDMIATATFKITDMEF